MGLELVAGCSLIVTSPLKADEKMSSEAQLKICSHLSPISEEASRRYEKYLELIKQYPATLGPFGDFTKGEIEIVRNPEKMWEIEQITKRTVGVVAQDNFWTWINDAVIFPGNKQGVYGRIVWTKGLNGVSGVVVLPILPDGRVVLNCNFRHATRTWEYELPRGLRESHETSEEAARREVREETGMELEELFLLGVIYPDTGLTNTMAPVYMAKVYKQGQARTEDSEAIASIDAFTLDELKEGFKQGFLYHTDKNGSEIRVALRDPFLSFALLQMIIRDILLSD